MSLLDKFKNLTNKKTEKELFKSKTKESNKISVPKYAK